MRNRRTGKRRTGDSAKLMFGVLLAVIAASALAALASINTAASAEVAVQTIESVARVSVQEQFEKEVARAKANSPEYEIPAFGEEDYQTEAKPKTVYRYIGKYRVTGYDACASCCGKTDAVTASGVIAEAGRTIAADGEYPFGTVIFIDGIGERVVEDRGGTITGNKIDLFCEDHVACYAVTGWYECYVVEEVLQ